MGTLIYSAISSLDGYVADRDGRFDWAAPDETVHAAVNQVLARSGVHLYGRRMYQVLQVWETFPLADASPAVREFAAMWRQAEKVVFSRSLAAAPTARTRLERSFDPDRIRTLKAHTESDVLLGGADLAGQALAAGLIDEIHLFLCPVIVGGGTPVLPMPQDTDGESSGAGPFALELLDQVSFRNGVVHLHHRVRA